jgi:hypothetical protein
MAKTIAQQRQWDDDTKQMILEGCSISQLARLFKMDFQKVKRKIQPCQSCGERVGSPIYSVKEAARYLIEPIWPIDEYIARMNHADLPMLLRKEFWAGMRSKQLYEIAAGDLWQTDVVIEHLSDILKTVSLSLRLASDAVDREVGLDHKQREIVIRLMDEALGNAHDKLKLICDERNAQKANVNTSAELPIIDDEL